MKEMLKAFAMRTGLGAALRGWRRARGKSRVYLLLYHRIERAQFDPLELCVSPENFERHLRFLCRHFRIGPLEEVVQKIREREPFQEDVVVLTFDDGYRDNFTNAYPLLRSFGIPATIFISTGFVGRKRLLWHDRLLRMGDRLIPALQGEESRSISPSVRRAARARGIRGLAEALKEMKEEEKEAALRALEDLCHTQAREGGKGPDMLKWEEIREMASGGVSFGVHTHSHMLLTRIPPEKAEAEIVASKRVFEEVFGTPPLLFAYPGGRPEDCSDFLRGILHREGFLGACTTIRGYNTHLSDPLALLRRGVRDQASLLLL